MRGSIGEIIKGLEDYKRSLRIKADALVKRLADAGCEAVSITYGAWPYKGDREANVTVEQRGPAQYAIVASGETVLILEFGAGVSYSATQHPLAEEMGYGPGTYPGQVHAMDPRGWYLPKSAAGRSGVHTYGNAPSMAMYNTGKSLREVIQQAAKEVFGG